MVQCAWLCLTNAAGSIQCFYTESPESRNLPGMLQTKNWIDLACRDFVVCQLEGVAAAGLAAGAPLRVRTSGRAGNSGCDGYGGARS